MDILDYSIGVLMGVPIFKITKLKAYKDQGSSFILCHDEDNDEYIHNLQQDETFEEGIFRKRYANGDTEMGFRYFHRSRGEKHRKYVLYKDNESGNIQYQDVIWGYSRSWIYQARYSFNPETLDWKKLRVENSNTKIA